MISPNCKTKMWLIFFWMGFLVTWTFFHPFIKNIGKSENFAEKIDFFKKNRKTFFSTFFSTLFFWHSDSQICPFSSISLKEIGNKTRRISFHGTGIRKQRYGYGLKVWYLAVDRPWSENGSKSVNVFVQAVFHIGGCVWTGVWASN